MKWLSNVSLILSFLAWLMLCSLFFLGRAPAAELNAYAFSGLGDYAATAVQPLAAETKKRCGIELRTMPHLAWAIATGEIEKNRGPVILFGYSMGAVAAGQVAAAIYPRRVALLVTLDPATHFATMPERTKNVIVAINYWKEGGLGGGHAFGARDIKINGVDHFSIEPAVRARIAAQICEAVAGL